MVFMLSGFQVIKQGMRGAGVAMYLGTSAGVTFERFSGAIGKRTRMSAIQQIRKSALRGEGLTGRLN
jgi:hypothetical protein